MRIAVASSGLGHVARGIEAWADDLAAALYARGEAVTLYRGGGDATRPYEQTVPCWQRESTTTRQLLRILPRRVSWRFGLGSAYGVEQVTFALNLIRRLKRQRADVLHVQDPIVAQIVQRAYRSRLLNTRPILAHGTEETADSLRRFEFLQHLAPWHFDQARAAGVTRPNWSAIPNFIDTDRFAPGRSDTLRAELGIPSDALVVLSVAAIKRHHKRVDYLLDEVAWLRSSSPELPVWLVVAGGWEAETDDLVAEGSRLLGDRVRFLVRFPRSRMPDLYRAADLFVLTSLFEMMPIAVLEATASGLPCVVHRHPILEWMVGPGGVTADLSTPGRLADELTRLLNDPTRRAVLGVSARAHCEATFSTDVVIGQVLDYYQQVLKSGMPSAVTR